MARKKPTPQRASRHSWLDKLRDWSNNVRRGVHARMNSFLARRPHRSFRRTLRRDYKRGLRIPGYIALSYEVAHILWMYKRLFGSLAAFYAVLSLLFIGLASQTTFTQLQEVIDQTSEGVFQGAWGDVGRAGLLLSAGILGSFTPELSEAQQIYSGLLVLLVWLTTVWLLRAIMSGGRPRLRDGLYNAGAPIVATTLIGIYMLLQSLPLLVATLIIGSVGLLGGVISLLFWSAAVLLIALSLYWLTGSFMALIVSTLPGMYPWKAIQIAGDMVVGRRFRILLRMIWLLMTVVLLWALIILPAILLNNWLVGVWPFIENIPFVPVLMLVVTAISSVWGSAYIYVLYRKVVDDDEDPA